MVVIAGMARSIIQAQPKSRVTFQGGKRVYSPPEQEGGDEDGDEHDGGADGDDGQGGEGGPVVVGPHRAPFQAAVEVAVAAHGSQRGGRRGRGHPEVFPVVERREVLIAGHHLRQHEGALSGRLQKREDNQNLLKQVKPEMTKREKKKILSLDRCASGSPSSREHFSSRKSLESEERSDLEVHQRGPRGEKQRKSCDPFNTATTAR
ncbi:hypothetical protein CEXT_792841 [Caerostris extrusa]|uniref:Uncharacterized protein n=1 Tax=Caerostris extrusa TaxID=172846 RepID=A0AAV4MI23_CAEEX|nr:hypothetical protein CEXT_792841 [Caerostris extrusa]